MSEPKQLALIWERDSCFNKAESGQSLSCTSITEVGALLLLQAALAEQLSVHLESGRSKHEVSAQQLCAECSLCALVFMRVLAVIDYSCSWDFFKAQARSWSQHNQFLLCRWSLQHIESRQHIYLPIWVPDTVKNLGVRKMNQLLSPFPSSPWAAVIHRNT